MLEGKQILLIVTGGISAIKVPDLIRRAREQGASVRCILTNSAKQFVTPLTLASLTEDKVYQDLFSLTEESEMGHIRLSRDADILLVAPATANFLAKMTSGIADDLATTAILATDKPVIVAPAMNVMMWTHPATKTNLETLKERKVKIIGPGTGDLACGETGDGRMAEVTEIIAALTSFFEKQGGQKPLAGYKVLITSGPTNEPIDPIRYITNRSSGKQGYAIAEVFAEKGASVTLVSGPTKQHAPNDVDVVWVETADQMMDACKAAKPVDIAVCTAAVADWTAAAPAPRKIKKKNSKKLALELIETEDILETLSRNGPGRPNLVIGFAAETENIIANGKNKLNKKNCDWIFANDVSGPNGAMGSETNEVHLITRNNTESWPVMSKRAVAERLVDQVIKFSEDKP